MEPRVPVRQAAHGWHAYAGLAGGRVEGTGRRKVGGHSSHFSSYHFRRVQSLRKLCMQLSKSEVAVAAVAGSPGIKGKTVFSSPTPKTIYLK